MPTCVAIKGDGDTCGRNAVLTEGWDGFAPVPAHLHFCRIHHRSYHQRVERSGHHQAGRCHYYTNHHWCEHDAVDGSNLCPAHIIHIDTLQQRARRQAEMEEQVRLLRLELMAVQPPRPWRAIVDALATRHDIPTAIRYRAGMTLYILREEGPIFHFNHYWNWVEGGRHGPEPILDNVGNFLHPPPGVIHPEPPRPDGALRAIARDAQNVHTTAVSQQTNSAVEKLLAVEVPKEQQTEKAMVRAWIAMVPTSWNTMLRTAKDVNQWFNTKTCRDHDDNLYRRILRGLVATIDRTDAEMKPELYKRLWEECTESVGMCCEGHISRLCNVLVGFDDAFKPPVPVGDILQQKMAAIAGLDVPTEMKHTHAVAVFNELNIPAEQRQAWLDAF